MAEPQAEGTEYVVKLKTEGDIRRITAVRMVVASDYSFERRLENGVWRIVAAFPRDMVEYAMEASQWTEATEEII